MQLFGRAIGPLGKPGAVDDRPLVVDGNDNAVDTIMRGPDKDWRIYHYEQDVLVDLGGGDDKWEIAPE